MNHNTCVIELNNGVKMPAFGLGTYQLSEESGEAHSKTAAQVIIRQHIQEGFSVIPGTSNPEHIKENIDVFDFELSDEEMDKIRALDKEARYFNMSYEDQVKWFTQWNPED